MAKSWLQHQHKQYVREKDRWRFAQDHYTGNVLHGSELLMNDANLGNVSLLNGRFPIQIYLVKRHQGESQEAYNERARLADYTNHFATVVDSLAGVLFGVEGEAKRTWYDEDTKKGLGDPEDNDTTAGSLMLDADGEGNGWLTVWKQLATELCVSHKFWVLVDSVDGSPRIRLINPLDVTNWRYDELGLAEVLVKEDVDTRESIMDDPEHQEQYVVFRREGWTRYRESKQGVETISSDGYTFIDRNGVPSLPIYCVELPLNRPVGWLLAKKGNAIFNKESERDHLLRTANFPRLVLHAGDDLYEAILEALKKGSSLLQAQPDGAAHAFIAPDTGPATVATEVLKRKVEEFYITGFREYGDSAKERTATEVKQDVSTGVGAFLQMLKAALDDAENQAMWRVEQIIDPTDASKHFIAHVCRSDNFVPPDSDTIVTNLALRYFGEKVPIPVGKAGRLAAAKKIASLDGISVDEDQLEAAIDANHLLQWFTDSFDIEKPAELRVAVLKRVLVATGLVPEDAMVATLDGEKKLLDVIVEQAKTQAEAKDEGERRQAESFGQPPGF